MPSVLDRAMKIPDLASTAAMHILREHYGVNGGPSTGVNFAAALKLIGQQQNGNKHQILKNQKIPTLIKSTWHRAKYRKFGKQEFGAELDPISL